MKNQVAENPEKKTASVNNFSEGLLKSKKVTTLLVLSVILIACYLIANIMAVKMMSFFDLVLIDMGTIIFPFTYMLSDVITELYGFKMMRRIIFLSFLCQLILVVTTYIGVFIGTPEEFSQIANSYNEVFSYAPRIVIASFISFIIGDLSNAYLMVKIKEMTGRKLLFVRTIGSSVVGHLLDTSIFCTLAFSFTISWTELIIMIVVQYIIKLLIEAIFGTPLAYCAINIIRKKVEQ